MLAIIYLLLCFGIGWVLCNYGFPKLERMVRFTYDDKSINLSPYMLLIPAWFICGVLAMTWSVYLTALIVSLVAKGIEYPLTIANAIIMSLGLIIWVVAYYKKLIKNRNKSNIDDFNFENSDTVDSDAVNLDINSSNSLFCMDSATFIKEAIFVGLITLLALILMWSTFYVKDGQLNIGVSVFSDFSPHVGMIRSFSYGNNFPTSYSHFAGEDIKYHFMLQFLVGNLEFLGLRIDFAFNIPSMISFIFAFMLLYVLTIKITGRIFSGLLTCLFFAFRSGKALFIYLSSLPRNTNIWQALWDKTIFIGDTPHEDWGLWNLNVYCNQRHLAFGLAAMFFILILFMPHLYGMFRDIRKYGFSIKKIFFSKEGWEIKNIRYSIASGLLLGSLSFFHGSAVIGCLLVLFVIAVFSKRRLELLVTAVIALILSLLQTGYFIAGSAIKPKFLFGFIAENRTIFGALYYLDRLLGILPLVIIVAFLWGKLEERYLIIASMAPIVFAFTVSLTVDVTVNHKYIMMGCILLGIFAANLISRILDKKGIVFRIAGLVLIIMLTITGIYDFTTVLRKNSVEDKIVLNMDDPLTDFVRENSDSKDVFLTDPYTINQLVFGGAMLYQGYQYYAWSAGYNTNYRDKMLVRMYEAETSDQLEKLVNDNNIRFIVVDYSNRNSTSYDLNEDNIRASYKCVFEIGENEWNTSIFDTSIPLA